MRMIVSQLTLNCLPKHGDVNKFWIFFARVYKTANLLLNVFGPKHCHSDFSALRLEKFGMHSARSRRLSGCLVCGWKLIASFAPSDAWRAWSSFQCRSSFCNDAWGYCGPHSLLIWADTERKHDGWKERKSVMSPKLLHRSAIKR